VLQQDLLPARTLMTLAGYTSNENGNLSFLQ
jgi:hypothetical protein